jgi:hypothetical protein
MEEFHTLHALSLYILSMVRKSFTIFPIENGKLKNIRSKEIQQKNPLHSLKHSKAVTYPKQRTSINVMTCS